MHPRIRLPLLLLAAIAVGVVSCRQAQNAAVVLAEVGSTRITAEDLQAEARRRMETGRPIPERSALLQEMVHHAAMLEKARVLGIDRDPEMRRRIENLLLAGVVERELTPQLEAVGVSEAEVEAEYERERARFTHPGQVRLAILFLETGPKASAARRAEQRRRMEEARRRVLAQSQETDRSRGGRAFGVLALEYSDDTISRHRGGDVGWIQDGRDHPRIPGPVLAAGGALSLGGLSEILETPEGVFLVRKTDAREAAVTPLAAVQASLRQAVLTRKRKEIETAFRAQVMAGVTPRVREAALAAVDLPAGPTLAARLPITAPPALPGSVEVAPGNDSRP